MWNILILIIALHWLQILLSFRYSNQYVDKEALLYLIMANEILHVLHPNIVTIAEDVSFDVLFINLDT